MSRNTEAPPTVVWHDLECGSYRADLPLWHDLARASPDGTILDIGAGSGRVALALARTGRRVIALDLDPILLGALRARAGGLAIEIVHADARNFDLPGEDRLALCLAPMQTVQLLGGSAGRLAFLRRARAHLRPGGLLACALVTDVESFDCSDGSPGPTPESTRVGTTLYTSRATRVEIGPRSIAIERERHSSASAAVEPDLVELDRVTVSQLEREGAAVGLRPEAARHIAPTYEHSGSSVVMLRA